MKPQVGEYYRLKHNHLINLCIVTSIKGDYTYYTLRKSADYSMDIPMSCPTDTFMSVYKILSKSDRLEML